MARRKISAIEMLENYLINEAGKDDKEFMEMLKAKQMEFLKESYESRLNEDENYIEWLEKTAIANGYKKAE